MTGASLPLKQPSKRESRFTLVPFDDLEPSRKASYLVQGLIPRVGVTLVYGPPKCGKTFWILDLLLHVALGWTYRNRRVVPGPVVYCVLEAPEGFLRRIAAFRLHKMERGTNGTPFYTITTRMSLAADHTSLMADIKAALGETRPAAIVLDTLKRSIVGSDSDDSVIGAYLEAADAVVEAFQCAVIVIHHSGLEAGRPRGSTALAGHVDAQLVCAKASGDKIAVTVQHMRDGPDGETLMSVRREVEIGEDEDGQTMTSMVVDHIDGPPAKHAPQATPLPKAASKAFTALRDIVKATGDPTVPKDEWYKAGIAQGVSSSAKGNAPKIAMDRALDRLVADSLITIDGNLVRLAS